MDENLVKRLLTTLKCGVCGQRYESVNIHLLGHRDELWFLSVFCPACHSQGLVAAIIKEGKAPEVITDLTREEIEHFTQQVPVGPDDLLDIHQFLKEFDGDFSRLFTPKE